MEHIIPESHLELLQAILGELCKANDPAATFVFASEVSEVEEEES